MPNNSPNVFAGAPQYLLKKEFFDFDFKHSCRVATIENITIATALNNGDTLDDVTLATNDRVLVKDQSTASQNGIYVVGASPSRATDFDENSEVTSGAFINIEEGTANADTHWVLTTNGSITVGTTGLDFTLMTAGKVKVTDNESTAENNLITFVADAGTSTGSHALEMDGHFTYNPSTGTVSATIFSGSGASLTTLNGSNISSGTVGEARMATSQTTIESLRNNSLIVGGNTQNNYIDFGTDDMILFDTDDTERFRVDAAGVDVTGALTATGDITAFSSDKRLKKDIEIIKSPLEKIQKLSGFTYLWNKETCKKAGFNPKDETQIGVFAQDVQEVIPEAVKIAPFDRDDDGNSKSGENYLTVQYEKIIPLLIESIKEQQKQIEELRNEFNSLKNK